MKEAIRLEPDSTVNHTCLAFLYLSGQNESAGIAELRETIQIAPFDSEHRGILSERLEEFGRTPEAIAELKNLLVISPRDVKTSNDLVELYLKHKDQKSAIAELQRSLKATSLIFNDGAKFIGVGFWDLDRGRVGPGCRTNPQARARGETVRPRQVQEQVSSRPACVRA